MSEFCCAAYVAFWHKADIPWPLADVRFWGESGGEALVLSVSAYDPKPTYEADAGQLT